MPPTEVIEDDATGMPRAAVPSIRTTDGLDFWESLEGMRVLVDDAVVVGRPEAAVPSGTVPVLADSGAGATGTHRPRRDRACASCRPGPDFNPEIIFLDSDLLPAAAALPGGPCPATASRPR